MFIRTQKIPRLILNNFGNLINILRFCMGTFCLSSESLLAEAYTFGLLVNFICLYWILATSHNTVAAECVLAVLGEEVLASDFFNCWVIVYCSFELVHSLLITTWNSAHWWHISLRWQSVSLVCWGLGTWDWIMFIKVLITRIKCHRPNLWKFHPRFRPIWLVGNIKLTTQTI